MRGNHIVKYTSCMSQAFAYSIVNNQKQKYKNVIIVPHTILRNIPFVQIAQYENQVMPEKIISKTRQAQKKEKSFSSILKIVAKTINSRGMLAYTEHTVLRIVDNLGFLIFSIILL